jgi:glycosyltransferase EpsF
VIRVLHLITSLAPGGLEMWLLSMLNEIPSGTIRMDFCCKGSSAGALADVARERGARVFHCRLRPDHLGFVRGVRELIQHEGYDVLHNHLEAYSGVGVWVGRRDNVPVITSFHNTHFAPQTPWLRRPGIRGLRAVYARLSERYAVRRSRYVTGCSRAVLMRVASRLRHGQVGQVLYYGMQPRERGDSAERDGLRREMAWPLDSLVVAHVGRMVEQKNHLGLLEVFKRVVLQVPRARLLCVGDGPLRPVVERKIAREGLTGRARCVGVRSDVVELLGRSDVLLLPSIHEGFGLVALEASGVGLPVVGSRIPGLDEVVRDGESGVLHAIDDVKGMAESVEKVLTDPEYGARLGNAGRQRVRNEFAVRSSAEQLERLYRECVGVG